MLFELGLCALISSTAFAQSHQWKGVFGGKTGKQFTWPRFCIRSIGTAAPSGHPIQYNNTIAKGSVICVILMALSSDASTMGSSSAALDHGQFKKVKKVEFFIFVLVHMMRLRSERDSA